MTTLPSPLFDDDAARAQLGLEPAFDPYALDAGASFRENTCRTFTIWLIGRGGAAYPFARPCGKWECPGCGHVRLALYRLQVTDDSRPYFGEVDTVFYLPTDPSQAEMFKKRRARSGAEWIYVPRTVRHYLSSVPLDVPGDDVRSVALDVESAKGVLCDLLTPGVIRKPGAPKSSPWRLVDERRPKGQGSRLGACPPLLADQVWALFSDRVEARFGFPYDHGPEHTLPAECDTPVHRAALAVMFGECVAEVKAKRPARKPVPRFG